MTRNLNQTESIKFLQQELYREEFRFGTAIFQVWI